MSVVQASPDESRSVESSARLGAFLTLGGVMAAHALLETARDALFLSHVSADRLPWVYLGIAGLALLIARLARGQRAHSNRARLIAAQLAGAVGTLAFWWLVDRDAAWTFYALYVWAGLISSLIVVGFWLCLADLFTITQGKRLYASIGTGGALGALVGFGFATLLSVRFDAELLLLFSAALFALSALGPTLLLRPGGDTGSSPGEIPIEIETPSFLDQLSQVGRHPYARRVAGLVLVSTATLTLGDFLFKSLIAHHVEADRLATWFGGIYLVLNAASVLLLLFVVTPTIRRLSVHRALAVLPGLIIPAAVGVVLVGGLIPILLLKAADGALRYSLQKTASELLYLPLASGIRESVKTFVDLAGQHGAKAMASIAILLIVPIPDHDLWIAIATVVLGGIWLFLAIEIRDAYLDVFRQTLSEGSIETRIDYPALDLASLESLIRTLSHPDERRVIAAMELLTEKDRVDLIPSLILYHPSTPVVSRALDLFATARRRDFLMLADRLLEHEDAEVRAAAVRALWVVDPNRERLEELSLSPCDCIRISAVSGLLAEGWLDLDAAEGGIAAALADHEPHTRMALANAIKLRYSAAFRESVQALTRDLDPEVRREAVRAIRASNDVFHTPHLVQLLDDRSIRDEVRETLLEGGGPALDALARALDDPNLSPLVERHLPRTIMRFASVRAAQILLDHLDRPHSGLVRYKLLRGLTTLLSGPVGHLVDKQPVRTAIAREISRAEQLLAWEAAVVAGQEEEPTRRMTGGELLADLLHDKGRLTLQRIFRLLYMLHPEENFHRIWSGLESGRRESRASSIELIENLLEPRLAVAVGGLIENLPAADRLRATGSDLAGQPLGYAAALGELADDSGTTLRGVALYHIAELGIDVAARAIDDLDPSRAGMVARMRARALRLIENVPESTALARGIASEGSASG
jgi:AAA family ATP:ADP antiporter